jgi:hypothetical protein
MSAKRVNTKYLVRFFVRYPNGNWLESRELVGESLEHCIEKLGGRRRLVESFTIYQGGKKTMHVPIELYGKL